MAFFGPVSTTGLFGAAGQQLPRTQIVGIGANLLQLSFDAQLTQAAYRSLSQADRAAANFGGGLGEDPAVIAPWEIPEEGLTLTNRVRELYTQDSFLDLEDRSLESVSDDPDAQATFALFKALDKMRTLAEYASDEKTITSTLGRLDELFQSGLEEVRQYLETAELDKLDIFLGKKEYDAETTTRTGKSSTTFDGTPLMSDPDTVISGLTGTETFDLTLNKLSVTDGSVTDTDVFNIDLSAMTESLTMNNIKDFINTQIATIQATDTEGDPVFDDNGDPVAKYSTTFDVAYDARTKQYQFQIDGSIIESSQLSASASSPSLFVAASIAQLDDTFAETSQVTEITDVASTLAVDNVTSFAAVDLGATEIKELTKDIDDDGLDPELAKLRDQMRADALKATEDNEVTSTTFDEEEVDEDESSITNINSENRVNAETQASRIATDSEGNVYVVGTSEGSFGHQVNTAAEDDVFLTKFDTEGNVVYSRLLGVSGDASAHGIVIDSADNIIVSGQTDSAIHDGDVVDNDTKNETDAFVVKYSARGDEVFRFQLDTYGSTSGLSVTVDASDDIILGGYTKSAISATSGFGGGSDSLVLKLDGTTGSITSSAVIGASTNESVKSVAIANDGNILVATEEDGNAFLRKLDATDLSTEMFNIDLGDLGTGGFGEAGSVAGITVDGTDIYIAGTTYGGTLDSSGSATVVGSQAGGFDGFVAKFTDSGASASADTVTYLGTAGTDKIADITVNSGKVYVAGQTTDTLSGESATGSTDTFVAHIDGATGAIEDQEQFGQTLAKSTAGGVAFTNSGDSVLSTLGLPQGSVNATQTYDIATQTSARVGDHFYVRVNGGSRVKIELEEGGTFDDIARQLRVVAFRDMEISISSTSEGDKLKLKVENKGSEIELIPGSGDQDLLERIGLKAGKILPQDEVLGLDSDDDEDVKPEDKVGGVFGLKLEGAIHLKDKKTAAYVLGLLDSAVSTVQRAYRSLTYNPLKELLKDGGLNAGGTVPVHIQNQLANYTSGLQRLQAGSVTGGGLLL